MAKLRFLGLIIPMLNLKSQLSRPKPEFFGLSGEFRVTARHTNKAVCCWMLGKQLKTVRARRHQENERALLIPWAF